MNTIKVFASRQEQIEEFTGHLKNVIERNGVEWQVEGHHTESGPIKMEWIQGVHAKDFPVISINNHAVWQTTLPPEEVVVSWLSWPSSIEEAVESILAEIPSDKLRSILNNPLAMVQLGQGIRNGFGLWTGNVALRKACGSEDIDADSASTAIIEALKKYCSTDHDADQKDGGARKANERAFRAPHSDGASQLLFRFSGEARSR